MEKKGYIYILTNPGKTVLYTGTTSNLKNRIWQHKSKVHPASFCARYNICILLYYEEYNRIQDAIAREKQIKAGSRHSKEQLIRTLNPDWEDLFDLI